MPWFLSMYKSASRFLKHRSENAARKAHPKPLSKEKRIEAGKLKGYLKKWRRIAKRSGKGQQTAGGAIFQGSHLVIRNPR